MIFIITEEVINKIEFGVVICVLVGLLNKYKSVVNKLRLVLVL